MIDLYEVDVSARAEPRLSAADATAERGESSGAPSTTA